MRQNLLPGKVRIPVRWNEDLKCFEMRCNDCYANRRHNSGEIYWPLTPEFWSTTEGVQRCRACQLARKRKYMMRARNGCTTPFDECRCGISMDNRTRQPTLGLKALPWVPDSKLEPYHAWMDDEEAQ